jgi:hypothetical protein
MSWQDDLRQLDADLAAGRVEPAAHRKQRDELLAQASGSTVPSPVPSPLQRPGSWQSKNPAARPVGPLPPPAQRFVEAPAPAQRQRPDPPWRRPEREPAGSVPEKTLSEHGIPNHLTTAPSPADINPTRYLRVDGRTSERPVSRFPPLVPPGARPVHHRPEEAEEPPGRHRWDDVPAAPSRRRATWPFIALGVLVVLAMIVGGTLWLGSTNDPAPQANGPAQQQPLGVRGEPLESKLPPLPGTPNPNNSTMSVAKGAQLGLYLPSTADLFAANGATDVLFRGAGDGDVSYLVVIVPTSSVVNAQTVVETLYQQALGSGFRSVQSDVRTVSGTDGSKFLNTTWYGSGSNAVIIGIAQTFRGQSGLSGELDRVVKAFEEVLPAG